MDRAFYYRGFTMRQTEKGWRIGKRKFETLQACKEWIEKQEPR